MTPVVNGLGPDFEASLEVRALNVDSAEGRRAFEAFSLPGHPSYILLNPDGEELWRSFGPLPKEALLRAIMEALNSSDPG